MKKRLKIIFLIIFLFGFLTIFITSYYIDEKNSVKAEEIKKKNTSIKKTKKKKKVTYYYIDVKGAVNNPGVYKITKDSRVNDCINAAGGLIEDADTSILNLSKKVSDEMIIIVYTKKELEQYKKELKQMEEINNIKSEEIVCPDVSNNACITIKSKEETKQDSTSSSSNNESSIISINTATKEELMSLNGIGEGKAESIIEYREENGEFKTIEDIKNVSGIGDSLFEKIKDYITI